MRTIFSLFLVLLFFVVSCGGSTGPDASTPVTKADTDLPICLFPADYGDIGIHLIDPHNYNHLENFCQDGHVIAQECVSQERSSDGGFVYHDFSSIESQRWLAGVCGYLLKEETHQTGYSCPRGGHHMPVFLHYALRPADEHAKPIHYVDRFTSAPTLALISDTDDEKFLRALQRAVNIINHTLPDQYDIIYEGQRDSARGINIAVEISPHIGALHGAAFVHSQPFARERITSVIIHSDFVSTSRNHELTHVIVHEIMHVLGFIGHIKPVWLPDPSGQTAQILRLKIPSVLYGQLDSRDISPQGILLRPDVYGLLYLYEELNVRDVVPEYLTKFSLTHYEVNPNDELTTWLANNGC